jgi:hypothetical protein
MPVDGDRRDAARRRDLGEMPARLGLVDREIVVEGEQRRRDHPGGLKAPVAAHGVLTPGGFLVGAASSTGAGRVTREGGAAGKNSTGDLAGCS